MAIKVDANKEVTSRLPIEPIKKADNTGYVFDGLCPIYLVGVHITEQSDEKGQFAGLNKKVLNFEFENFKFNTSDPDRFYTHSEKVIGNQKKVGNDYQNMDAKKVEGFVLAMWGRIKHILDSMQGMPNYRSIAADKGLDKLLEFPDADSDAKTLVDHYNKFFEFVCTFVVGNDKAIKPMYLDDKENPIALWAKLLPDYSSGKRYAFPTYVEKGFLERIKLGTDGKITLPKVIKIYPKETLELSSTKKTAAPGANNGAPITAADLPAGLNEALGIS